jgi:OOP family OmpA-OmpF porin
MAQWQRWIRPGLITTFVIALLAIYFRSGVLEDDLAGRVRERLAGDGHDWAEVEVSGRNVTLRGVSPSSEAQAAALLSAGSVAGVGSVADASSLLPLASPYAWSVKKAGPVLTLIGSVPSEGFRSSLLAATRRALPDAQIHDEMQLARGASPAFNAGTAFVLDRLEYFEDATLTISDSTLSVAGTAADREAFAAARLEFVDNVPSQLALGPLDILPARADPFVWSAAYDGSTLSLAGYVPDEIVGEELLQTAKTAFPDAEIGNEMEVASGAPEGFADAALFAIGALTRFDRGGVALDGMELDITGKAKTVDDYESVLAAFAGALPQGMRVVTSAITPATVSDYGWRGARADGKVTLAGFVPSPEAKNEVVALADDLFGDDELVDEVRIAAGEPRMDWIGAIKFAMRQLDRLTYGSVVLDDRTFSIEGEAESSEAFTALLADNAQTLPASLELGRAGVRPPAVSPFRFAVAREPDVIRVGGHVESEQDRDAIVSIVRDTFGSEKLEENLIFASGAPDGYMDAARVAVHAVSRLAGGHFELNDANVNIAGGAYYPAVAGAVADAVGDNMPSGFNVALSVDVRQPAQPVTPLRCRDLLERALSVDRIEFDGGNREISPDSYGALDRVAATVARCPEATIEVAAHTDSDGSTSHNLELSQARADAILEYLVDAGVKRERITAIGHGEAAPVADNSTEAGKTANRRIEFVLAVPEDG